MTDRHRAKQTFALRSPAIGQEYDEATYDRGRNVREHDPILVAGCDREALVRWVFGVQIYANTQRRGRGREGRTGSLDASCRK